MLTSYQRRKVRVRNNVKKNNKSNRPRMVVNRTNKNIYAQIVSIDGNVLVQSSSILFDEKISGVKKAQIVGKTIAELCKKVDIDNIVFDKGAYNYNGRVKALADACREFGLKF
jgi:large subunit ribosomal protein L18